MKNPPTDVDGISFAEVIAMQAGTESIHPLPWVGFRTFYVAVSNSSSRCTDKNRCMVYVQPNVAQLQ